MKCRHCKNELSLRFVDLGTSPPSNSYLSKTHLNSPEVWYPLRVLVCEVCWLVQTEDYNKPSELFGDDYAYFSSFSTSWLEHSRAYAEYVMKRFNLDKASQVIEVAANDGYLLQYFQNSGVKCLGVEPTKSTAMAAEARGLEIIRDFFGTNLAEKLKKEGRSADLLVANNVLAHVPDINDFAKGFAQLLKPNGIATFEFPHLLQLIKNNLFDTIYHEHYSYLSLISVEKIFSACGLQIFDVEELPTHGGSIRIFVQRADSLHHRKSEAVTELLKTESQAGLQTAEVYKNFQKQVEKSKDEFLSFLIKAKQQGKTVGAYGAAAKGNTFLNFAGIRKDLLPWVIDRNPEKQNKFLPGSRIPIVNEEYLKNSKPDFLVLLPWNLEKELMNQLTYIRDWGGQFVIAQPILKISK